MVKVKKVNIAVTYLASLAFLEKGKRPSFNIIVSSCNVKVDYNVSINEIVPNN